MWVMVFDPDGGGNRAVKQRTPSRSRTTAPEPWSARIGESAIDDVRQARRWPGPAAKLAISPAGARGEAAHRPVVPSEIRRPRRRCVIRWPASTGPSPSATPPSRWTAGPVASNHNWGSRYAPRRTRSGRCAVRRRSAFQPRDRHRAALGPLRRPRPTLFVLRHAGREVRGAFGVSRPAYPRLIPTLHLDVRRAGRRCRDAGRSLRNPAT